MRTYADRPSTPTRPAFSGSASLERSEDMDLSPGPEIWRYPHIAGRGEGDQQDIRSQEMRQDIRSQDMRQDIRSQNMRHDVRSQDMRQGIRSPDMRQGIRSQDMQVLSRQSGELGRSTAKNKDISGRAADISGRAADISDALQTMRQCLR